MARSIAFAWAAAAALQAAAAGAHTIVVDGDAGDWFGQLPAIHDLGHLTRTPAQQGEFVWRDRASDERPVGGATPASDLTEFRVTADGLRIYFMARLAGPAPLAGAGAPMLQVAIDPDRMAGLGTTSFAEGAQTELTPLAAWSALLVTRFASGSAPLVLGSNLAPIPTAATAALSPDGVIEASVPWSALGYIYPPNRAVRFAAALFVSTADDHVKPLGLPDASNATDVVTNYGDPGAVSSTAAEIADSTLDYAFDVPFTVQGEPASPISISEVFYPEVPGSEWIELVNVGSANLALEPFRLGDEETPDGDEGMAHFPAGASIPPGGRYVVASRGTDFFDSCAFRADAEFEPVDPMTPDMATDATWAKTASIGLPAAGDEVLVADAWGTVLDVYAYGNGAWPGVSSFPDFAPGRSVERLTPGTDSDDCGSDFAMTVKPTPGAAVRTTGVGPGESAGALALTAPSPNPFRSGTKLTLRLPSAAGGGVSCEVLDLQGRRVRTLLDAPGLGAGDVSLAWDARDEDGRPVPTGLYLVRVRAPGQTLVARAVHVR